MERGCKGAEEGKRTESRRLEITFSTSLKFLCRCHCEELPPTCGAEGSGAGGLAGSAGRPRGRLGS